MLASMDIHTPSRKYQTTIRPVLDYGALSYELDAMSHSKLLDTIQTTCIWIFADNVPPPLSTYVLIPVFFLYIFVRSISIISNNLSLPAYKTNLQHNHVGYTNIKILACLSPQLFGSWTITNLQLHILVYNL